ncbi:ATP-dependent RNA helicase HrpA [Pseudobowmanella zhangzhouensis]|uniref:ATP-dependent RNA helicase HrpA n=1 Tax=Pseudobowmanella zhangzhouensis TaxID=1537679 RepID=A0ABW1XK10_9ALTE
MPSIQSLFSQLDLVLGSQRQHFRRKINALSRKFDAEHAQQLADEMAMSALQVEQRRSQLPQIDYPDLPVSLQRDAIKQAIEKHQVVIIAGETGSGKTTQLPKICLELGRGVKGLIGHTQPRRLAARSVANRIADELGTKLGDKVGFKVRFSDQVSDSSYIKLMTDGILLTEIQQDRFLNQYDTLIIDEAHERSLNIDFILGYLKQLLPKRPDLKLIITSATIDPERFSRHFNDAPMISVSGRTYPVDIRYRPLEDSLDEDNQPLDQTQGIIRAVNELSRLGHGDILVFLSGEREIRDTADALAREKLRNTEIVPLYARLSAAEQQKIFSGHTGRRIVLATNVAETSLTVPGIKYVIDPGTARISRYSTRSKVQRLPIEAISQASANQRAGRCGRVSAGVCIRLYSEQDFLSRPEFTDPEILRTNLASVVLQMLALKFGNISDFPFIQPPDNRQITDAMRLLEEVQAIANDGSGKLTDIGQQIARLPVDPRYARMVVQAAKTDALAEVIVIVAGLSIQDPRERPQDKQQKADEIHKQFEDRDSDFVGLLKIWRAFREQQQALTNNQLKKWCQEHMLNYLRMREWQDIVSQLKKSIAELGFGINREEADFTRIHQAILSGLLSHIGCKDNDRHYLGARGSKFLVFPGSALSKGQAKWVMAAELVETSRLFARMAAKIQPEWLEPLAGHLIKRNYAEPFWSKKQGAVMGYETVTLYGLPIVTRRQINFERVDAILAREIFIREALINGQTKLDLEFLQHNRELVLQVEELEEKTRRRDLLVDEQVLMDFYLQNLPEHIASEASLRKWWQKAAKQSDTRVYFERELLLQRDTDQINRYSYPDSWQQGNVHLPLEYRFDPGSEDDGVSMRVPVALLNQLTPAGFDWLVPGMREELIVSLIKQLPKRLRRNFVPAPDYARACMQDLTPSELPFIDALAAKLAKMSGVKIDPAEWSAPPLHLQMNFKVLDEQGKVIAQGRDLLALQHQLSGRVQQTLRKVAKRSIEQQGLQSWSFDQLPQAFTEQKPGYEVKAFPALVDEGDSVAIKLFDQPQLASDAHKRGLLRLLRLQMPSPLKYLQEKLPNKAKLGLYFNPFGQVAALVDDCIDAAIVALLGEQLEQIRDKAAFNLALDKVRGEINDAVLKLAAQIEPGLTLAHQIKKKMKGNVPLNMINAHGDIQQQLDKLVYPGFVSDMGAGRVSDWFRYLKAIERRLEKLPLDPNRDRMAQLSVQKVHDAIEAARKQVPVGLAIPARIHDARWMLEELRVSLFAQNLGTAHAVSEKRILNYLHS